MTFKVGDKVKCVNPLSKKYGRVGEVLEVFSYGALVTMYDDKLDYHFSFGSLELVEDTPMQVVNKYIEESPMKPDPFKDQVGGGHYKSMKIQPVEFIVANGLGFCEGNAIKYLCRYKQKNGVEDLKKAKHYIEMLIAGSEKENN